MKTFRYKIYPSKAQTLLFEQTLGLCAELYNAALQERRDAYKTCHKSIGYFDQDRQMLEIKALRPDLKAINAHLLANVLKRVDLAFAAFFRRVKAGETAGYPRFRSRARYNSITYRAGGFGLQNGKLKLSKVGLVKIKLHRPLEGKAKTVTIKREAGRWFALFAAECLPAPLPVSTESIGIDVGLTHFATLSDGVEVENPRYFREAQKRLRKAQRKVSRRKKGSHRRRKAVQLLQRAHAHVLNQRGDHHHKLSERLVARYGLIVVEDLNIKGLAAGRLAKSVNDAGWSAFIDKLTYKAENAGRLLVKVDARGTSQTCLCGAPVHKTLDQRRHECATCGLSAPRDHVSAQLILGRGLRLSALTCSTG